MRAGVFWPRGKAVWIADLLTLSVSTHYNNPARLKLNQLAAP